MTAGPAAQAPLPTGGRLQCARASVQLEFASAASHGDSDSDGLGASDISLVLELELPVRLLRLDSGPPLPLQVGAGMIFSIITRVKISAAIRLDSGPPVPLQVGAGMTVGIITRRVKISAAISTGKGRSAS